MIYKYAKIFFNFNTTTIISKEITNDQCCCYVWTE